MDPLTIIAIAAGATTVIRVVSNFIAACEEERARELVEVHRARKVHLRKIERIRRGRDARSFEYAVRGEVLDYLTFLKNLEYRKVQNLKKHIEEFSKQHDDLYRAFKKAKDNQAPRKLRDDLMENLARLDHDISLIRAKASMRYDLMKRYGQMKHDLVSTILTVAAGEKMRGLLPEPEEEKISELPATLPIRYDLIEGRIRAPQKGIWVELPRGFAGYVSEEEDVYNTYDARQKVETFIKKVDYIEKTAIVSLNTPRLLRRFSRRPDAWFKFEVTQDLGFGYRVRIEESLAGFLHKRVGGRQLSPGKVYSGRLGRLNKFFLKPSIVEIKH